MSHNPVCPNCGAIGDKIRTARRECNDSHCRVKEYTTAVRKKRVV